MLFSSLSYAGQDILLPVTVRTATNNSGDIYKSVQKSVHIIIVMSVVPGTDTVTPSIQGKDALGNYYNILVGAPISTTGNTVLKLGLGAGSVANGAAADMIPDVYRVVLTHSAASSFTYAVTQNTAQ
jgi:hypothetical protein